VPYNQIKAIPNEVGVCAKIPDAKASHYETCRVILRRAVAGENSRNSICDRL
jgi:hypothetical protein